VAPAYPVPPAQTLHLQLAGHTRAGTLHISSNGSRRTTSSDGPGLVCSQRELSGADELQRRGRSIDGRPDHLVDYLAPNAVAVVALPSDRRVTLSGNQDDRSSARSEQPRPVTSPTVDVYSLSVIYARTAGRLVRTLTTMVCFSSIQTKTLESVIGRGTSGRSSTAMDVLSTPRTIFEPPLTPSSFPTPPPIALDLFFVSSYYSNPLHPAPSLVALSLLSQACSLRSAGWKRRTQLLPVRHRSCDNQLLIS